MWKCSLLKQNSASQKVRGSIPNVTGFFNWSDPSSCTKALEETYPLTEMSTRKLPGGKKGWCMRLTSPPSVSQLSTKMWKPQHITTIWPPQPVTGIAFTYCTEGWMGPTASLDDVERRKNSYPYKDLNSNPLAAQPVDSLCTQQQYMKCV
jgi:hypothetical protein